MRIAVVEFAGKGGLIHYAWQLSRALQDEGAEVTLITGTHFELETLRAPFRVDRALRLWDPKPETDTTNAIARRVRRGGRAFVYYREWLRLLRLLRELNPDVVQFGDIRFSTDVVPLSLAARGPWLLSDVCHNVAPFAGGEGSSGTFRMSPVEKRMYTRAYDLFDAIFVHYDVNVEAFASSFPRSAGRVTRIVHGNEELFRELADPHLTRDAIREEAAIAPEEKMVLFFGTLSTYKGLDLLLQAFAVVARRIHEAVLVVAGHEPPDFDRAAFLEEALRRGVVERLRLVPGYVSSGDVQAWMEAADVVVFPYRNVFQSGALHVAQTFGAPIVATRVGAMPEVIRDGETGRVVDPAPDAIAAGIIDLLENPTRAKALGAAAATDAATRFSWRSVASTMLTRYDSLLRSRA